MMIKINHTEVHAHGSQELIMSELSYGVREIALKISTEKEVAIDVVVADIVRGATLGKYELVQTPIGTDEYMDSVELLRKWAKAYYHHDNPIATDEEYDTLYHKVMRHETKHDITNERSPTQFVGWKGCDDEA